MLNRNHGPTWVDLQDAIGSPEPHWALLLLSQPPSQIPAITIPQESERFSEHRTFVSLIRRGVLHQYQVAVKDSLKKGTNRPTLLEVSLFGSARGSNLWLVLCRLRMKNIAGSRLKADELLCFCQK